MEEDKTIYELGSDEFLRRKIKFLHNKVKEIKAEIKLTESILESYEKNKVESIERNPKQLTIENADGSLDFSITRFKPLVFNYLFENPTHLTTEQILIGVDANKAYQKNKLTKSKAIKSVSSSLFLLHKEGRLTKVKNDGRKGFKWKINDNWTGLTLAKVVTGAVGKAVAPKEMEAT